MENEKAAFRLDIGICEENGISVLAVLYLFLIIFNHYYFGIWSLERINIINQVTRMTKKRDMLYKELGIIGVRLNDLSKHPFPHTENTKYPPLMNPFLPTDPSHKSINQYAPNLHHLTSLKSQTDDSKRLQISNASP